MIALTGAIVGIYVDLVARVEVGHIIQTQTGRRYGVVSVRVQQRGKHRGRQHLRCVVLASHDVIAASQRGARDPLVQALTLRKQTPVRQRVAIRNAATRVISSLAWHATCSAGMHENAPRRPEIQPGDRRHR